MSNLPIIFRVDSEVTAVFPTLPGTNDPNTFTVYAHVGQHGSGCKDWYHGTRAAKEPEYRDLLAELRSIYETGPDAVTIQICQRFTRAHDKARKAELLGY